MKKTNVASLRSNLSSLLEYVEKGKEIEIQRRNVGIAKIVPLHRTTVNKTKLGKGKGTVKFYADITESIMVDDWEMHEE